MIRKSKISFLLICSLFLFTNKGNTSLKNKVNDSCFFLDNFDSDSFCNIFSYLTIEDIVNLDIASLRKVWDHFDKNEPLFLFKEKIIVHNNSSIYDWISIRNVIPSCSIKGAIDLKQIDIMMIQFSLLNISTLDLSHCKNINDFTCLSELKKLEILNLNFTKIDNKGLFFISILPDLKMLFLNHCSYITDFFCLSNLQSLQILNLSYTKIKNKHLKSIEKIYLLSSLSLSHCIYITDITPLRKLWLLKSLNIYGTSIVKK